MARVTMPGDVALKLPSNGAELALRRTNNPVTIEKKVFENTMLVYRGAERVGSKRYPPLKLHG